MNNWLPWALLIFVVMVLAAMPWRRPHPNHEFMLHMLGLLEQDDSDPPSLSSSTSGHATSIRQRSVLPSGHTHQ